MVCLGMGFAAAGRKGEIDGARVGWRRGRVAMEAMKGEGGGRGEGVVEV